MAIKNKWYYMALAKKKKTPRQMPARYAGTCSACHGPIAEGEQMVYLGATRDCWHVPCYHQEAEAPATTPEPVNPAPDMPDIATRAAEQYAGWKAPTPPPEPEKPARPTMSTVKLDSKYGRHEHVKTDALITWGRLNNLYEPARGGIIRAERVGMFS